MKLVTIFLLGLVFMMGSDVFAHGEDKMGPHGGYIRMPGAFHTELVPAGDNAFKVYLLDMQWKNASVKNSKLKLSLQSKRTWVATCASEADYFLCKFKPDPGLSLNGELVVEAVRDGQIGKAMSYPLPLKLEAPAHSGH